MNPTNPEVQPEPGAQKNPMLRLGLPFLDIEHTDWITLPKREAKNFTDATPFEVKPGDTIYRVYGLYPNGKGGAKMKGGYWSPSPPAEGEAQANWRNNTAVPLSWNAGTKVAALTAKKPIQAWRGGIFAQHAQDTNHQTLDEWFLTGGDTQIWIPSWPKWTHADPSELGPTPWTETTTPSPEVASSAPKADFALGQVDRADAHHQHALCVVELAESLRSIADAMINALDNEDHAYLQSSANLLIDSANRIVSHAENNENEVEQLTLAEIKSHTGLSRFIDVEGNWQGADNAVALLDEVIEKAVAISEGT
ncbi:MAG: hypothetical protein AAF404_07820 [Pseudomonadota bacterium]